MNSFITHKSCSKWRHPDFDEKLAASREQRILKRKKKRAMKISKAHRRAAVAREKVNTLRHNAFFVVKPLTPIQLKAIDLLSDFIADYSMQEVSDELGINNQRLQRWMNRPEFLKALNQELDKRKTILRREAFSKFFGYVQKGKYKALTDYFRMTGDLTNQLEVHHHDDGPQAEDLSDEQLDNEIQGLANELGLDISDLCDVKLTKSSAKVVEGEEEETRPRRPALLQPKNS